MADLLADARWDGSGSYLLPDGRLAIPVFTGGGFLSGGGAEGGDWSPGALTEYWVHPKREKYAGTSYDRYTGDGQFLGTGEFNADIDTVSGIEKLAMAGLAIGASLVVGNALGIIGAPGGAGASAGATAGTTQAGPTLSKAALDGTSAFGANSVPGAYQLATVAAPVAQVAGATAGGTSLASVASAGLSAVKTALGLGTAVAGARAAATRAGTGSSGGAGVGYFGPGVGEPFPAGTSGGVSPWLALAGLALVGGAVFFGLKKG